ncbi:hypothetical protein C6376_37780 [Streptomyces sp. P3]|nr:hypothetical protein C6376_37780 [Streptomyces sp. P3]
MTFEERPATPAAPGARVRSRESGGTARPRRTKGKGNGGRPHSLPLSTYSAPGGLRQDPRRTAESQAEARTCGNE